MASFIPRSTSDSEKKMISLLARQGSMGYSPSSPKSTSFIKKNQLAEDVALIIDAIKGNYVFLLIDLSKQRTSGKKNRQIQIHDHNHLESVLCTIDNKKRTVTKK